MDDNKVWYSLFRFGSLHCIRVYNGDRIHRYDCQSKTERDKKLEEIKDLTLAAGFEFVELKEN